MSENLDQVVERLADPSERMAEHVGQALCRAAVPLYDVEPVRAGFVYSLGVAFLERAAVLRSVEYDAETAGGLVDGFDVDG